MEADPDRRARSRPARAGEARVICGGQPEPAIPRRLPRPMPGDIVTERIRVRLAPAPEALVACVARDSDPLRPARNGRRTTLRARGKTRGTRPGIALGPRS